MIEMNLPQHVKAFTDGASRGNPGPAAIGIVFYDKDKQWVAEYNESLGNQTNNYAEYMAVIRAMEIAVQKSVSVMEFYCDSELLVKQMSGIYQVKAPQIKELFVQAKKLAVQFKKVEFNHVRREFNKEADALANQALDSR